MTPRKWRDLDAVLSSALDLPESEQDAWVARECEGRPELRDEVESLLHAHQVAGTFIEPRSNEGRRLGPYRLLEQIGIGGMGAVYRAERDDGQFRQEVAIKVMAAGLEYRPEAVRHFLEERQILASLTHVNIARLLDGGYAGEGTPYIVMEYVVGTPITTYCIEHGLDLRARLGLFLQLTEGIHFAHQHLVIHRDIKPANTLVTSEGVPKLLDFGIAKLVDSTVDATGTIGQALTPDYASPEQVRGGTMTTASDVYSLGVLLYELVAGVRPYRLADQSLEKAVEYICTRDPAPPSAIVSGLPADLDAIVLKAMRKEPRGRYASVREFAEDIERHLTSQPVRARDGTLRYVTAKFVRRHRAGVTMAAAMAVLLCGSGSLVLRESQIARQERDRAQRRFDDVRQLAHSVIFDLHDKVAGLPGSTPVRKDLIASAIGYVDRLAKDSSGDTGLQRELAESYLRIGDVQGGPNGQNLGESKTALQSYCKAEEIARRLTQTHLSFESTVLHANTLLKLGIFYSSVRDNKGEIALKEALAIARRVDKQYHNSEEAKRLLATSLLSMAHASSNGQSLAYQVEALPLFEGLLSAKPADFERQRNAALIHKYIGAALGESRDESLKHFQRAMELDQARVSAHPDMPAAKLDLSFDYSEFGTYYQQHGDPGKALNYLEKMLAIRREVVASDPKDIWKQNRLAWALAYIASLHVEAGDPGSAMAKLEEAKTISEHIGTSDNARLYTYALTILGIAEARRSLGNKPAACAAFSKSRDLFGLLTTVNGTNSYLKDVEKGLAWCGTR